MTELTVDACMEKLEQVLDFIRRPLNEAKADVKRIMKIELACEEVFANIVAYAYADTAGTATISVEITEAPVKTVHISFSDNGTAYDPLEHKDPDVGLTAEERDIGGLGIFLVRKTMDEVSYERRGDKNVLTIKKELE